MSLIEQYYKRTCAGFWPYVINTEDDDDEDVLDGSQWHQTINIRPWQENVIGTNDAYFHTVAWYRAWGKIADVNELAACATRWKVPVPCSNVLWNLLLNESEEDILVMLFQPDAWAKRTRGLLSDDIDWMNWARQTDWAQHDTGDTSDKTGTPDCVLCELPICYSSLCNLF